MAATDSLNSVAFPSDMSAGAAWEHQVSSVPYSAPISIPDAENIMAEFSMYESAITTPVSSSENLPSLACHYDQPAPRKRPISIPLESFSAALCTPSSKRAKVEHTFATEPCTPHSSHKSSAPTMSSSTCGSIPFPPLPSFSGLPAHTSLSIPKSPNPSLCTDEPGDEDPDTKSVPSPRLSTMDDIASSEAPPPLFASKELSARRRALRRIALNKARAKKEEGVAVAHSAPLIKLELLTKAESCRGGNGIVSNGSSCSGSTEPVDKKAARAIRNREAAMKSRIEAKQKMRKLQDENSSLSVKVQALSRENEALTGQLRSLLQHTLGVSMGDGQDVKQIFDLLTRMNSRSTA